MKSSIIVGIVFILLGILFLGPALSLFSLTMVWPVILLLVGIGCISLYFVLPRLYGLLMPGAILILSSIPFFICTWSHDWSRMTYLWPLFIIAVSAGFFLMYWGGKKQRGLLIPAFILLALGVICFFIFRFVQLIFPILFIAAGLILLFLGLLKKRDVLTSSSETEEPKEQTP